MCKFNGHLFVFVILVLWNFLVIEGSPVKQRFLDIVGDDEPDEIYDQRQKGEENIRLRINGVLIAAPVMSDFGNEFNNHHGSGSNGGGSGSPDNIQDYLDLLTFLGANKPSDASDTPSASSPLHDEANFLELLEYFPFKKRNSNTIPNNSVKEDTHARNKISPSSNANSSEKQLDDVDVKPKDVAKDQPRKQTYRFLKYLVPVLQRIRAIVPFEH